MELQMIKPDIIWTDIMQFDEMSPSETLQRVSWTCTSASAILTIRIQQSQANPQEISYYTFILLLLVLISSVARDED